MAPISKQYIYKILLIFNARHKKNNLNLRASEEKQTIFKEIQLLRGDEVDASESQSSSAVVQGFDKI